MPKSLLTLLSKAARAMRDDEFVEVLLQAWAHVVPADTHSLIRHTEENGLVEFWQPGEGRLGPDHRVPKLFARLWAMENPMDSHPCVAAFLKNGPGAYLRSALEEDAVWKRRAHYRLVDRVLGIEDMVSVFLAPSNGTLVMLHAGSRAQVNSPSTLRLADEFAALATALLVARGGFAAKQLALPGKKLTPREIEILNWVGKGKQNIEIASILGRSPHTIRKHLENIFSKLGVETRTAAVDGLRDTPRQSST
jgi:DNA-binding CsgD family transcriptional regulator